MNFSKSSFLSKFFKINKTSLVENTSTNKQLNFKTKNCNNLHDNLKQLEFISCLEMHLDTKNESSYSLNFLQDISKIKHSAQINTIQSIQYCKQ